MAVDHSNSNTQRSAGKAVAVGYLVIIVPSLGILFGVTLLARAVFGSGGICVGFLVGFVLAWAWSSFMLPRWWIWALKSGVAEDQLWRVARRTGLVWPKGWFEKKH